MSALVHVKINRVWFFWIWRVMYDGVPFIYDRSGLTLDRKKAFKEAEKATVRIVRYENRKANAADNN